MANLLNDTLSLGPLAHETCDAASYSAFLFNARALFRPLVGALRTVLGGVRAVSPALVADVLDDVDDAGLVILLTVPAFVCLNLLYTLVMGDSSKQVVATNRQYTILAQKCAALEVENGKLRANGGGNGGDARKHQEEMTALRQGLQSQYDELMSKYRHVDAERQRLDAELARCKAQLQETTAVAKVAGETETGLRDAHTQLQAEHERLEHEYNQVKSIADEATTTQSELHAEVQECHAKIDALSAENVELSASATTAAERVGELETELTAAVRRCEEAQLHAHGLQEIIEHLQAHTHADDTKQSTDASDGWDVDGWDDVDDDDADGDDEKPKKQKKKKSKSPTSSASKTPAADLFDVAKLRATISKLESDLREAEASSADAHKAHAKLEKQTVELKDKLARLEAKSDEIGAEKNDMWSQTKRLTKMLDDTNDKLTAKEKDVDKVRAELHKLHDELRAAKEAAATHDEKVKECEREIARLKRDAQRQETRHFHEIREARHAQDAAEQELSRLRQQVTHVGGGAYLGYAASISPMERLQRADSGGNSSEAEMVNMFATHRDYHDVNASIDSGESSHVHRRTHNAATAAVPADALGGWSSLAAADADALAPSRRPRSTHSSEFAPGSRRPKSRPDDNSIDYASMSLGRSAGRKSAGPSASASYHHRRSVADDEFMDDERATERRRRRQKSKSRRRDADDMDAVDAAAGFGALPTSAAGVYSSPGSAGGVSPPPEMALVSGVPPTGVRNPRVTRGKQRR